MSFMTDKIEHAQLLSFLTEELYSIFQILLLKTAVSRKTQFLNKFEQRQDYALLSHVKSRTKQNCFWSYYKMVSKKTQIDTDLFINAWEEEN